MSVHPSSPCSVPAWLRPLVPIEAAAWQACCAEHDEYYARGGTEHDRFVADVRFLLCMLLHDVPDVWALRYYQAVRVYGRGAFGTDQAIEWPQPEVIEAP